MKHVGERGHSQHSGEASVPGDELSSDTSSSSAPDSDSMEEDDESNDMIYLNAAQRVTARKHKRRVKRLREVDHLAVDPRTYGHHLITSPGIPY